MTQLKAGAATDVGRVRQINEDRYLADERLFAVADGVGGHQAGEVASQTSVETLQRTFEDGEHTTEGLITAAEAANQAVWQLAQGSREKRGMGTTLTALALVQEDGEEQLALAEVVEREGPPLELAKSTEHPFEQCHVWLAIGSRFVAPIGEALHGPPYRLVRLPAQLADDAGTHIVHFTSGWSRMAACAASYCSRVSARNAMRIDTYLPLDECFHEIFSCSTSMPATFNSRGSSASKPMLAVPMALSSKVPGNWKPCSGLSDLSSIRTIPTRARNHPTGA